MHTIEARELLLWQQSQTPFLLLDVREAWEVEIAAIPGAVNIPMTQIGQSTDTLPASKPIVVMCHHGIRSAHVIAFLRSCGFDQLINLRGGIDAWAEQVDQDMPRY